MKALAAIALVAVLAHATALVGEYTFDDHPVVESNPRLHVRSWRDLGPLLGSNYWGAEAERTGERLFRPVPLATFALERALVGRPHPGVSRAVNVALHALAAMLALALFRLVFEEARPAFLGALVFALHPRHAEAVAGVVGRAEVLALAAGLAALLLLERRRFAWAAVAFLIALGSKESAAAILPIAIARARLARRAPRAEVVALLGATLVYAALRAWALGALVPQASARTLGDMPLSGRLVVAAAALRDAWLALLLPRDATAAHYPFPDASAPGVLVAVAVQAAAVALVLVLARRGPRARAAALGIAAVELAWLPVSNLVPIGVVFAERLLYAPSAWASLAAGAALARVPRLLVALLAGYLALASARADLAWRDDLRLWETTVARHPAEPRALLAYGECLVPIDPGRAVPPLEVAARTFPDSQPLKAKAFARLAQALRAAGAPAPRVEAALNEALYRGPGSLPVLLAAARLRLEEPRYADARALADRAVALAPRDLEPGVLRAVALRLGGDPRAALAELARFDAEATSSGEAVWNRAEALWALDRRDEALADYRRAAELLPAWRPPHAPLALILRLAEAGRRDEGRAALDAIRDRLGPADVAKIESLLRGNP